MQIEKLGIGHKELLSARLKAANTKLSEYTFANLFLFRGNHDYDVVRDRAIFIRGRSYDGATYLMPAGDVRQIDPAYLRDMMQDVDFLFPLPEEWLGHFDPVLFDVSYNKGDADYVYTAEKMSTYKGRNLHKKRNLLKQFLEGHTHDARPLTNDRLVDARSILNEWLETMGGQEEDTDYGPCLEALDRYEELVLCGGIYYADSEPAGFLVGEELNEETFVLHFAKAKVKFKGVYQYMFNNFAKVLPPRYRYLNLEQDLDKENLRVFKSSYVPDALIRKARVSVRGGSPASAASP
jgi:hypothetical protein